MHHVVPPLTKLSLMAHTLALITKLFISDVLHLIQLFSEISPIQSTRISAPVEHQSFT